MFKKLRLYYRTVKHLKPIQIRYRLWYILRDQLRRLLGHSYPLSIPKRGRPVNFKKGISKSGSLKDYTFTFLNREYIFKDSIDWNFDRYGKLWTYNLNYFSYLNKEGVSKETGLKLILEFIHKIENYSEGLESYPISLRGMNWIKFLSINQIENLKIDSSLYSQYLILLDNLEYHVLGNHILENSCSMLFGAFYFQDDNLWIKAYETLTKELNEQVLKDGGHFERSTMYHCITLERLLDCYNLLQHNSCFDKQDDLKNQLNSKIVEMLGWLKQMQWKDGDVPEVNDHIPEMLPDISKLFSYASRLNLQPAKIALSNSGYRKYRGSNYEILTDVGNIGPDYVLGHAHSDIFSFLLRIDGKDMIVDCGTSTYENNERRNKERSTRAHNTVMVDNKEQNEIWYAFRVGRRGQVDILKDKNNEIKARHDGYSFLNVIHERSFQFDNNSITICDCIKGENRLGTFHLHFSPDVNFSKSKNVIKGQDFQILFDGHKKIQIGLYEKATGYDKLQMAKKIVVYFKKKLHTHIKVSDL